MIGARLRAAALQATRSPAFDSVARAGERVAPIRRGRLVVLTWHRVDDPARTDSLNPSLVSAVPSAFASQVRLIADRFRPVALEDVLEAFDGGRRLPPRSVLLTFDDAYRDFATEAWPVLRRAGVPATLFVPTAYPDSGIGFWWDRIHHAIVATQRRKAVDSPVGLLELGTAEQRAASARAAHRALRQRSPDEISAIVDRLVDELSPPPAARAVLDWDELRSLDRDGVTLAPHSRTHPYLDRLEPVEAEEEVAGSIADLRREVRPPLPAFAYPHGADRRPAADAVRRAGTVVAFTTERGGADPSVSDPLHVNRVNVGGRAGLGLLRLQLAWAPALRVAPEAGRSDGEPAATSR